MANHIEDQFAFIINNSIYSSSQEHLLLRANFALEIDTFSDAGAGNSPSPARNDGGGERRSEIETGNLGFGGEIDGGVEVKVVRPLRCVALDGGEKGEEFVENVVFEGLEDGERRVEVGGVGNVVSEGLEDGERRVEIEGVEEAGNRVKFEGVSNVVIEGVEDGEDRVEVESVNNVETVDEGMSKDTEVMEVVEEGDNCGVGSLETEVIEEVEEGDNCVVVEGVGYMETEVIESDEEGGNCGKVDERTSNVDTEVIEVVEEEENRVGNVDIEVVNVDEKGGNRVQVGDICDLDDGISGFEKVGDSAVRNKVDNEVVGVDKEQGDDCAKVVVEEEEVNNTSRKDNGDASRNLPGEDASRGENTSINKEQVTGKKRKLPRSLFEQWGSGHGNGESCSKGESLKENRSEKSLDGEASSYILDALKFLVGDKSYGGKEGDFFETVKRRGMTFPPPRFRHS